jgi:pimeloyl-ACP methyl ester carboxylesterase
MAAEILETKVSTITVDGIEIFYRHAGSPTNPTVLLLHGFPSSSHQYRNLIPLLSPHYHVVAPDLPGFGFTTVPAERQYTYSFASLTRTIASFLDAVKVEKFSVYIFDYGAPVAFRLALERPNAITAIFTQNGNAYVEGLGADFWAPIKQYWQSGSEKDRETIRGAVLNFDLTKWQYTFGSPHPEAIQPESYYLDAALLERKGNKDIQLDLFYDYRNNVELYPRFHDYLEKSGVPVLAVWGKNDPAFIPAGAEAYRKDVKDFELHFLDAGHFALETNELEISKLILSFLKKRNL